MDNTTQNLKHATVASFTDFDKAEEFYNDLLDRWYSEDNITAIMTDEVRDSLPDSHKIENSSEEILEEAGEWALSWGAIWGIIWAILALWTNVVFPVAGLVITWPLLWALVWAWAGWIVWGIIGALSELWFDDDEAEEMWKRVQDGEIIIMVDPATSSDKDYFDEASKKYDRSYYSTTYTD